MANPFSDPEYTKKYLTSQQKRYADSSDPNERTRIMDDMKRVSGATGVNWQTGNFTSPSAGGGIGNGIGSGSRKGNSGLSFVPTNFNYRSLSVPQPTIDWSAALARAKEQLDPIRTQARTAAGVANQQQSNLIRQQLAAGGNLKDDSAAWALAQLSSGLQNRLADIDASYGVQAHQLAQGITDRDIAAQQQAYQNALTRWQLENALNLQAAQQNRLLNRDVASDRQYGMNYAAALLPYFVMTEAQRYGIPLEWTQVMNEVPNMSSNNDDVDLTALMQLINMFAGGGY